MLHEFGTYSFCIHCGQSRESVVDNVTPTTCQASPNVTSISNRLSARWFNATLATIHPHLYRPDDDVKG